MNLTDELKRLGLSQAELARATGLSHATISLIASGHSPGRPATLRLIRAALAGYTLAEPGVDLAPPPSPPEPGSLPITRNPNKRRS